MKALVLGCGSIGLRHIGHLFRIGISDVCAVDVDEDKVKMVKSSFDIPVFKNISVGFRSNPDIILICTPAESHVNLALRALEVGSHVFIEKPIALDMADLDLLIANSQVSNRVVQVGYNLRFHPAMKAMKELVETDTIGPILSAHLEFGLYLKKWWPNRDYRTSYMANRDMGGGLLMDASHEIDLLMWYLGGISKICAIGGKLSSLDIDSPDTIKVLFTMQSGAVASMYLDCLQPSYTRVCNLISENGRITWDCPDGRADTSLGRLTVFGQNEERSIPMHLEGNPEDTYVDELQDFVHCVETGRDPLVGVREGVEVLRVVEGIKAALDTGAEVEI